MAAAVTEAPVYYRFTPAFQGIQLEIWELAAPETQSDKPFLFRVKYLFSSQHEAQNALEDYLRNNGLSFAADDDCPHEPSGGRRLFSIRDTRSLNP